jgi:thermitase
MRSASRYSVFKEKKFMKKRLINILFSIFILVCGTNAFALQVRVAGDRLSIEADQVPLQEILTRLAVLGIQIRIDPEINPTITASFEDRDIRTGLGSILKSLDYVLFWSSVQGPSGPISRLAEIEVFRLGKKGLMKPLITDSTLHIVKNSDGSLMVKDEILLRLRLGSDPSELNMILRQIGGILLDSQPDLGIYRIRLPENTDVTALLDRIKDLPNLEEAEPNYAYPLPTPMMNAEQGAPPLSSYDLSAPGGKAPVAVLDTGMMPNAGLDAFVLASQDALNPDEPISDSLGHGTQMALIAAGLIRPDGVRIGSDTQSPIIPIRAFDDNGFTSNFHILNSIEFAVEHGARVLSLSWGSETRSDFLESAMDYAGSRGLMIIASAGNEPTGKPVYPAAFPSVIGVGALGRDGKPWERSNYGAFVTLYAPGFASFPVGYKGDPGLYAGTSISAAFVANLVAEVLSRKPEASRQDIMQALTGNKK